MRTFIMEKKKKEEKRLLRAYPLMQKTYKLLFQIILVVSHSKHCHAIYSIPILDVYLKTNSVL